MSTLALTIIFTALLIFVSWLLFYVKDKIVPKMIIVGGLALISVGIFSSFESYKGWPSKDLPNNGRVLDIEVDHEKAIYVWIFEGDRDKPLTWFEKVFLTHYDNVPRVFVLPYSKELEKQFSDAKGKLQKGYFIDFRSSKKQIGESGKIGSYTETVPELTVRPPDQVLTKQ